MEEKEPSQFKQEWEAKKLLKQTKKKARKSLMERGHGRKDASKMVNKAIKNIYEIEIMIVHLIDISGAAISQVIIPFLR